MLTFLISNHLYIQKKKNTYHLLILWPEDNAGKGLPRVSGTHIETTTGIPRQTSDNKKKNNMIEIKIFATVTETVALYFRTQTIP